MMIICKTVIYYRLLVVNFCFNNILDFHSGLKSDREEIEPSKFIHFNSKWKWEYQRYVFDKLVFCVHHFLHWPIGLAGVNFKLNHYIQIHGKKNQIRINQFFLCADSEID